MTSPGIDEARVVAKVSRRIVPYIFICYIVNYLDRFNVSFAALEMSSDLGFSEMVYGLGASMFFVGYVLFEIPSNLIMMRVGARVWIARIMITWGLASTCMMLVKTAFAFYLLRFVLGIAEAGFFPGMILYLTYWIPAGARARAFALFLTSTSLAGVFGGPLSGALFKLDGVHGLRGWQWLFMLEGLPAVVLGLVTLVYLVDRPANAKWLSQAERDWLTDIIEREQEGYRVAHDLTLFQALRHRRVWQLCLLYFSIIIGFYGIAFWLPQVVKSFSSLSNSAVAVLSAVPYVAASILMVMTANHSDRSGERRWHVAVPSLAGSFGLAAGVYFLSHGHPVVAFLCICVTASGIWSTLGPFWSLPTAFLSGTAAAGGVALINSIGNIGGFVGPYMIGYVKETTGSYMNGMLVLAATLLIAAGLALRVRPESVRE